MGRRSRIRLEELLGDAEVPHGLLRGAWPRPEAFLQPFVQTLASTGQRTHARHYVPGLLSDLPSKGAGSIAYPHDRRRQGLHKSPGQADWDHRPLLTELARPGGAELGEPDGVLAFGPSAFAKEGTESVGVQRQCCGRRGQIDNCQVGIYLAYASRRERALLDVRLYLPRGWATDRKRRQKAGVPRAVRLRRRHRLALGLLDEHGAALPHAWVSGDDERGRRSWLRGQLRARGGSYLLAVPSNTRVRDLRAPDPPYSGHGRRPRCPGGRVGQWCAALPEAARETPEVRGGDKGPLVVQAAWAPVPAKAEGRPSGVAECLVVLREQQGDGTGKHGYLLSKAVRSNPLPQSARVFKARHRVEECLKRAKGQAGLADYPVRTWGGWHHHQALSMPATWFLRQRPRRGKNPDTRAAGAAGAAAAGWPAEPSAAQPAAGPPAAHHEPPFAPRRGGAVVPLAPAQALAAATLQSANVRDTAELQA